MSEPYPIEDVFIITDPDTLKVVANPLRLEIMKLPAQPGTVKAIADHLNKLPDVFGKVRCPA